MSLFPENSNLSREYTWDICYQFFKRNKNQLLQADCDEELLLRASEILCPWDNRSPPNGCIQ